MHILICCCCYKRRRVRFIRKMCIIICTMTTTSKSTMCRKKSYLFIYVHPFTHSADVSTTAPPLTQQHRTLHVLLVSPQHPIPPDHPANAPRRFNYCSGLIGSGTMTLTAKSKKKHHSSPPIPSVRLLLSSSVQSMRRSYCPLRPHSICHPVYLPDGLYNPTTTTIHDPTAVASQALYSNSSSSKMKKHK